MDQRLQLIVYGDFNCPFSALASARVSHLEGRGIAEVDWRAVEHAPDIPPGGRPVIGDLADELRRELDQIRTLLDPGEADQLALPTKQANTRLATGAYASASDGARRALRERLFAAYWIHGEDLTDPGSLERLGAIGGDGRTAPQWHDEWLALPQPIVPVMVMPDGYVSRGLGAIARLAQLSAHPGLAAD